MAKILIVEDEAIVAKDIEVTLKGLGYEVVGKVDNGTDAIEKAAELKPDLILMDIMLKGSIDGVMAAERINKAAPAPIVYLTAHSDAKTLQRAKITEPFGYIVKPFEDKELHSVIEMALYKNKSEQEKAALRQQVISLTKKIPLTDNEKRVFYSIIKHPLLNDIELSKLLKMKRSTITAIKNKLKKENYYHSYRLPSFEAIGCELLTVFYGTLEGMDVKGAIKDITSPELVFLNATHRDLVGISISQNLTDFRRFYSDMILSFRKAGLADNFSMIFFPFELSDLNKFLDYTAYLSTILDFDTNLKRKSKVKPKSRKLTKNEKVVMYALVKYPGLNDSEMASKIKLPRPSISQTRRRLLKDGLIQKINVPDLIKIRAEIMVFNHFSFGHTADPEMISELVSYKSRSPNAHFLISGGGEVCSMDIFDDYTKYERANEKFAAAFRQASMTQESVKIMPVLQMQYENIDFAPLVKKVLGLKVNF